MTPTSVFMGGFEDGEVRKETKEWIRGAGRCLFALYMGLLVYFLFFAESYGRVAGMQQEYRYNLKLFEEIKRFWIYRREVGLLAMILNIFGNVIGFVPFGYILPVMTYRFQNWLLVTLGGFSLSLCVETVQLVFRVGCFDVDDLVLNTLGAFLGYVSFWICNEVRRKLYGKEI